MNDSKKTESEVKAPENLVVYDPDKPLYEKKHLCIYLRELWDEVEKEAENKINTEAQQMQEEIK